MYPLNPKAIALFEILIKKRVRIWAHGRFANFFLVLGNVDSSIDSRRTLHWKGGFRKKKEHETPLIWDHSGPI